MKNLTNWDWERVKIELSEGKSNANELKQQLNPITITASSREACQLLMEKLISSYDNALALINNNDDVCNNNSNNSLNSVEDVRDKKTGETEDDDHKLHAAKKRKRVATKRGEQVRVSSEMGFEGQINDGYNWRKYGQKVILKATHPRAYYRCTHRHTQGCLATKQVQKADDDPSIFQVLYIGKHTCCSIHDDTTTTTTKHSIETNKDQDNYCPKIYVDDEAKVEEDRDDCPLFPFPPTANNPEEYLKIKSVSEGNDYLSASHFPVDDFPNFLRSDFAEMISSPTRVGDFVFGDIDTHFLDACW